MSEAVHIALNTTDLKSSVYFYRRFLGSGPAKQRPGYAKFQLADPPLNLALNEVAVASKTGINHLGLQVSESSAVWQRRKEVEASGLSTRTEEDDDTSQAVQSALRSMMDKLPDADRAALHATEWEGRSQKELAEIWGLSVSGAKSRVQRARQKLRELLLDCCHFELDARGKVTDMIPRQRADCCCNRCEG